MQRKLLLQEFLGALGAVRIQWGEVLEDRIYGTVLYDELAQEERQDFVWHMREDQVPSDAVTCLLKHIRLHNLMSIDKLTLPVSAMPIDFMGESEKQKALADLLDIEVRMLDDGKETDVFFIHE